MNNLSIFISLLLLLLSKTSVQQYVSVSNCNELQNLNSFLNNETIIANITKNIECFNFSFVSINGGIFRGWSIIKKL